MKRATAILLLTFTCLATTSSAPSRHPHIYGIAYVKIQVSNVDKAREFYSLALHSVARPADSQTPCNWCKRVPISADMVPKSLGPIELEASETQDSSSLLKEVAFRTDDVKALREHLQKNRVAVEKLTKCGEDLCFSVRDPEQHRIIFVQESNGIPVPTPGAYSSAAASYGSPIIHAGFVVRDRAAEDR